MCIFKIFIFSKFRLKLQDGFLKKNLEDRIFYLKIFFLKNLDLFIYFNLSKISYYLSKSGIKSNYLKSKENFKQ